jgi:hypothetical protein
MVGECLAAIPNHQFSVAMHLDDRKDGSCIGFDEVAFVVSNGLMPPVEKSIILVITYITH